MSLGGGKCEKDNVKKRKNMKETRETEAIRENLC
jgi:hypothetical protein